MASFFFSTAGQEIIEVKKKLGKFFFTCNKLGWKQEDVLETHLNLTYDDGASGHYKCMEKVEDEDNPAIFTTITVRFRSECTNFNCTTFSLVFILAFLLQRLCNT